MKKGTCPKTCKNCGANPRKRQVLGFMDCFVDQMLGSYHRGTPKNDKPKQKR